MESIAQPMECPACGNNHQRRIAADVVAIDGGRALLIRRRWPPDEGMWAVPGGYVECDETVEDAARREFNEETGLTVGGLRLAAVRSSPDRHPKQVIAVIFLGEASGEPRAGDDATEAAWFQLDELPEHMARDHRDGIDQARELFQSK